VRNVAPDINGGIQTVDLLEQVLKRLFELSTDEVIGG
jgi:hypothetical protein